MKVRQHEHKAANQVQSMVNIETLGEGTYDEAAEHESFLEALNAWRNAGKPKEENK